MEEFEFIERDHIKKDLEGTNALKIFKNENYKHIIHGNYSSSQVKSADCLDKLVDYEYGQKYPSDHSLLEKQDHLLHDIAKSIVKTSSKFDIDQTGATSLNDELVRDKVI